MGDLSAAELEALNASAQSIKPTPGQLGYVGASMAPGFGATDAIGEAGRMPTGNETLQQGLLADGTSMAENFDQGNYLDSGLQGLGLLGDAAYAIPVAGVAMGNLMKAPRAVKLAADAIYGGKSLDDIDLSQTPDVPQSALERYDPPRGMPKNLDQLFNKETAQRLSEAAKKGEQAGGRDWYNLDPLRQAYIDELGPEVGDATFRAYVDKIAATSPRSTVAANIRRSSYLQQLDQQGKPFAGLTNQDMPAGYGHLAHQTQDHLLQDLQASGRFDAVNRPKTSSFAENLKGNQTPMTIDTHNFAAVKGDPKNKVSPSKTQYRYLEDFQAEIADKLNMTPAQFQASVWMGADTGVADARPFMEVFDDVVARTAKRNDESKKQALTKFIKGEGALYGLGGLMAGTVYMSPESEPERQGLL